MEKSIYGLKKKERKLIMAMWLKIETAAQLSVKPSISNSC